MIRSAILANYNIGMKAYFGFKYLLPLELAAGLGQTQLPSLVLGVDLLDHPLHCCVPVNRLRTRVDHHPVRQALQQPLQAGFVLPIKGSKYVMGFVKKEEHPPHVVLVGVASDGDSNGPQEGHAGVVHAFSYNVFTMPYLG